MKDSKTKPIVGEIEKVTPKKEIKLSKIQLETLNSIQSDKAYLEGLLNQIKSKELMFFKLILDVNDVSEDEKLTFENGTIKILDK